MFVIGFGGFVQDIIFSKIKNILQVVLLMDLIKNQVSDFFRI